MRTRKRFTQQRVNRWLSTALIAALIASFSAFGAAPAFADGSEGAVPPSAIGTEPVVQGEAPADDAPDAPADGQTAPEADGVDTPGETPLESSEETEAAPAVEAPAGAGDAAVEVLPAPQASSVATPAITVTPAPHNGGVVTITGTGFAAAFPGIYLGVGPAGLPGFYQGSASMIESETSWVSVDNSTGDSDMGKTATMNADGSFEFTVTVPKPTASAADFAIYTSKAHGQGFRDPTQNTITSIVFAEAPVPTVIVSKTSGIDPSGEFVTVSGTGFEQTAATTGSRPPLAGKFTGSYVVFGRFADVWKPTASAPGTSRVAGDTKWAVLAADMATVGGPARGAIELNSDGTFEAKLWVTADFKDVPETGNFGIYTYPGGGAKFAPFETYTPIEFTIPLVATSTTLATSNNGPVALGTTVTLTAGVSPASAAGAVQFFSGASAIGNPVVLNAQGKASLGTTLGTAGSAALSARYVPDAGAAFGASTSPTVTISVQAPPAVPGGTLSWGVDSGFRNYVTGPAAQGSIALSGGATSLGATYHFGQGSASFDHASGTGSAGYVGTVRFTGHNGALDLHFANPTVRVDSASSGVLLVTVNGSTVTLATLNLAAATRSSTDGATRFSDVPAILTSAGATAFEGFYGAGRALSSVSFTVGSVSAAPSGASGTVSTASLISARVKAIPATPPATSGIDVQPEMLKRLLAGGQATVTVTGFQPNETGIRVVIYSTPTVLAENLTADASGTVSWTGSLPVGLSGTHTLTFQGSIDRGIILDIPAKLAAGFCPVQGAELRWGLKERFRDYVLGGIASGSVELAGGTTEIPGGYSWSAGTGEFNADSTRGLVSLPGSVRFAGHGGILDTTIANPRIEIENTDRAYLLLDVTGTTQQGEAVNAAGVRFAEVTLSGASTVVDGNFVVTDAAAVLTEQGTASFGTYPAGEQLDPVSFSIPLPADCAPAAPATEEEKPAADADAVATVTAAPTADLAGLGWLVGALVLLAALIAAVVLLVRRARGSIRHHR